MRPIATSSSVLALGDLDALFDASILSMSCRVMPERLARAEKKNSSRVRLCENTVALVFVVKDQHAPSCTNSRETKTASATHAPGQLAMEHRT